MHKDSRRFIRQEIPSSQTWEIPVTSYTAGAYIPAKTVRCIKVERNIEQPADLRLQALEIFGWN